MSKTKSAPEKLPHAGGSYTRDPKTGALEHTEEPQPETPPEPGTNAQEG